MFYFWKVIEAAIGIKKRLACVYLKIMSHVRDGNYNINHGRLAHVFINTDGLTDRRSSRGIRV